MNDRTCRLCMKTLYGNKFDIIEEITTQMLDALLLKINLDIGEENVMCLECARKLQNAITFKTACLSTDNKRLLSVTCQEIMKSAIKGNSLNENTDISEPQKVCRFCNTVTESGCYTCLQEHKENIFILDMVQKYIPELNLCVTEEVVTCKTCLDALLDLLNFTNDCLRMEEKVDMYTNEKDEQLKLNHIQDFNLKDEVSCNDKPVEIEKKYNENIESIVVKNEIKSEENMEIDNVDLNIGKEEIDLKSEPDMCESFQDTTSSSRCTARSLRKLKRDSYQSNTNRNTKPHKTTPDIITYNCNKCPYKTKNNKFFNKHMQKHEKKIKIYRCKMCVYTTTLQGNLEKHKITHQNLSEETVCRCERCSFETIYSTMVDTHLQTPEAHFNVLVHKCDMCSYETNCQNDFKNHMLLHQSRRSSLEMNMYTCAYCAFQTKRKWNLKAHMLVHRDVSEVPVYKCERCSFQSKHKISLKQHYVTHQEPEFVCKECSYETKDIRSLKRHLVTHQDMSEVKVYACERCLYKTKFKDYLKKHMLVHQDLSEAEVFECDRCLFKTKHKMSLRRHELVHQELSEAKLYACEKCSYLTKQKSGLKRHMRIHQKLKE